MDRDPSISVVARDGAISLAGMALRHTCTFVVALIVTRRLGPTSAGRFFTAVAVFTMGATISQLGAHTGLMRTIARSLALQRVGHLRTTLHVALMPVIASALTAGMALWLVAPRLAPVLLGGVAGTNHLRIIAALMPFATMTSVLVAGVRGFGGIGSYAAIEHVGLPLGRLGAVTAATALTLPAVALTAAWAVPSAVAAAIAAVVMARQHRAVASTGPQKDHHPPDRVGSTFWRFSAPRGVSAALQVIVQWSDVVLIAALASPFEAGIYAAASRTVVVGTAALEAVRIAIAPRLSGLLARGEFMAASNLYQVSTLWLIALSWPVFLIVAIFAPTLLAVFGPAFVKGTAVLTVLAVAMMANLATGNVTTVLLMAGHSGWNLLNGGIATATNIALNLVLIPRMGMLGAALAWLASIVVENLSATAQVRGIVGVTPVGRGYAGLACAVLVCYACLPIAVRAFLGTDAVSLSIAVACATLLYVPALRLLREAMQLDSLLAALPLRRLRFANA